MKEFIEIIKVVFLGIVEGITEWLPISSTGHMILVDEFLRLKVSDGFKELFLVVIQLGAIFAVPIIFFKRLYPFSKDKSREEKRQVWYLWFKIAFGVIPAAVIGFFLDDFFDEHFYNFIVVAVALVIYGVAFILVEKLKKNKEYRVESVYDLTFRDAFIIGAYQTLSFIPGTSRSGSTILGGMLTGVSRTASAEFSFFMAIPIVIGASFLKIVKFLIAGFTATPFEVILLLIGMLVSFVVSLFSIDFLMKFVKNHDLKVFGVYRIALGAVVIGYFLVKALL